MQRDTTPWFSPDAKPARAGYYNTRIRAMGHGAVRTRNKLGGVFMRRPKVIEVRLYWNGRVWVASPESKPYTAGLFQQQREWQGLFSHAKGGSK